VLAAVALGATPPAGLSRGARERAVRAAVRTTAAYLGNTPAVCRASYIDPRVVDRFLAGASVAATLAELGAGPDLAKPRTRARVEAAVLDLLT
jgi:DNA topoisomerase IB